MGVPSDSKRTCARIIAAAGELFAEHGYHGVTVRDIIQKAKTHQSALNYHFDGKEALYRAVLIHACDSPEFAQLNLEAILTMSAREALEEVIKAWIRDYMAGDEGLWKAKLVDRECLEPSTIFREAVAAKVLPSMQFVAGILARAVDRLPDEPKVQAAVLGLLGQVNTLTLYRQLLDAVAQGLYEEMHRGDWLAHALAESAIAFAKAGDRGSKP